MYDKQSKGEIISFDLLEFNSSCYEIWKDRKLIEKAHIPTRIIITSDGSKGPTIDGIEVKIDTELLLDKLTRKMNFDIAITSTDRYLLCIAPKSSNAETIDSFAMFLNFVPFRTRERKIFNLNEPHACSIFFINGKPNKITFSVTLSKTLIEFYS